MTIQKTWLRLSGAGIAMSMAISAAAAERLVLRSGFEPGCRIVTHPKYAQNHTLTGKDITTGHSWDQLAEKLETLRFAYVIGGRAQNPGDFVNTALVAGKGRNGSHALEMSVLEDFPGDRYHTRNELSLFPKSDSGSLFANQGFARYWMKLDTDVAGSWPMPWYNLFEVKEQQVDGRENYRFNFRLHKEPEDELPSWGLIVHNAYSDDYEVVQRNREVKVPVNEWFKVEGFWKRHATNGRLFLAINGETVFDFRGRTVHLTNPRPVRFWSPLKNYRHRDWHKGDRVARVWYDDLELWTGFPVKE